MEIRSSQRHCILTPLSPKLDEYQTSRLNSEIKNNSSLAIGIDLSFVSDCTIEFIEAIKSSNVGLFNIPSDIFSLFNLMSLDKVIPLYTTEEDFKLGRHRLLNRKFSVI